MSLTSRDISLFISSLKHSNPILDSFHFLSLRFTWLPHSEMFAPPSASRVWILLCCWFCCFGSQGSHADVLDLMHYNVRGVPWIMEESGQSQRLQAIPEAIQAYQRRRGLDFDILVICELWESYKSNSFIPAFAEAMRKQGYLHQTSQPDRSYWWSHPTKQLNHGLKIFSRYPIIREASMAYSACGSWECRAGKGALYAQIQLSSGDSDSDSVPALHVVSTHMQSGDDQKAKAVRRLQVAELAKFVASQHIPSNEPTVITGDWNMERYVETDEIFSAFAALGVREATLMNRPQDFNGCPAYHLRDFHDPWTLCSPHPLSSETTNTTSWLDYIVVRGGLTANLWALTDFQSSTPLSLPLALTTPFVGSLVAKPVVTNHLSDHIPLRARLFL